MKHGRDGLAQRRRRRRAPAGPARLAAHLAGHSAGNTEGSLVTNRVGQVLAPTEEW